MSPKHLAAVLALLLGAPAALAAPATPAFNTAVKIGEGNIGWRANRPVVTGANVYAIYATSPIGAYTADAVRLGKSGNSGATWDRALVVAGLDPAYEWLGNSGARLAMSDDQVNVGGKILHATFIRSLGADTFLLYSWYATARPELGWSAPIPVHTGSFVGWWESSLVARPNGEVHVLLSEAGQIQQFVASGPGQPFGAPVLLPIPAGVLNVGDPAVALDSAGTLHVAFATDCTSLYYTKRAAGGAWQPLVRAFTTTPGNLSNDISLAAADPSALYLAFAETDSQTTGSLSIVASTNGGSAWSARRPVLKNYIYGMSFTNPSIVAWTNTATNPQTRTVTVAWETWTDGNYDTGNVKVWRSSDHGATWSAPAVVRGQGNPAMVLDAGNKVNLVVLDEVKADPSHNSLNILFLKEK